jgi:hypothetical protein
MSHRYQLLSGLGTLLVAMAIGAMRTLRKGTNDFTDGADSLATHWLASAGAALQQLFSCSPDALCYRAGDTSSSCVRCVGLMTEASVSVR